MSRLMIRLDNKLLDEAVRLSGARTKREAVELALQEFVRRRRLRQVLEHAGKIGRASCRERV